MSNTGRDAAANRQMADLIRQGQAMQDGKGVGYSMIAPNVAARATGVATLTPKVQIVNVSGVDVSVNILDYIAQPIAKKQGTSATPDITDVTDRVLPVAGDSRGGSPGGAQPEGAGSGISGLKFLSDFAKDFTKYVWESGIGSLVEKTPAAANAIAKGIQYASSKAGIPNNIKKPLMQGAASLLTLTPVVGNVLSLYEVLTGKDWYTQDELTIAERGLALIGSIPGGNAVRAIANTYRLGVGGGAATIRALAEKNIFKFIDKTEKAREFNSFLWSESASNVARVVAPGSYVDSALTLNQKTKELASKVLVLSAPNLPWQEEVKKYFKKMENTGQIIPGM